MFKRTYVKRLTNDVTNVKNKNLSVARQSEGYKFLSNVIWVGLGQLFISLTALVVLPALTKNYPAQTFGLWAQMVATIGFLMILTLKFESATIRFLAAEENLSARRRAVGAMLWPILLLCSVLIGFSLLFRQELSEFLFAESQFAKYVPLLAAWASIDAILFFLISYQRAIGRIKLFAFIRLASSVTRMLAIVSLATASYSFYVIVVSVIVIQSAFAAGALILIIVELGFPMFNSTGLKKYLVYSIPLLPGTMLYWVINVSDRYFIAHIVDISHAGIYSASYSLAGLLMLLSYPIGMVFFPLTSKLWDRGEREKVKSYFEYSMKLLLLTSIPACAGLYFLSQSLLGNLATSEFKAGGLLVLVLSIGISLSGVFLINEYIIYLVKKTTWLAIINGVGAVINIIMNIIMIPSMGIMAAAISTLVSFLAISVIVYFWGRQYIAYKLDYVFIAKTVAATLVMSVALWFINVDSIMSIFMVIIVGISIYSLVIYLLKAFSSEDKRIIMSIFAGLKSNFKPG